MSVILATWEAEIRRIVIQGQPRQKVSETPSLQKMLNVVVHTCHPIYAGSINQRIKAHTGPGIKVRPLSENK
jgi:hypothetical protein